MGEFFTINNEFGLTNTLIPTERLVHRQPPCHVMIEGAGGSGKSTLVGQYKLLYDIPAGYIPEDLEDRLLAYYHDGHLSRNTMFVSEPPPFFRKGADGRLSPINAKGEVLDRCFAERMICGKDEPSGKTALNELRCSDRYTHERAVTLLTHARIGLSRYVEQERKGLIVHDRGFPSTLVYNCDWEGEDESGLDLLLLSEGSDFDGFLELAQTYYDEYVGVPDKETVHFINYLFKCCPDFVYDIFFLLQSDRIAEPLKNLLARTDDKDPFDQDLKSKILALCRYKAIARLIREGPLSFLCKELVVVSPDYSSGINKISWPALALSTLQNYAYYGLPPVRTSAGLLYETLLNGVFSHSSLLPENASLQEVIAANPITKYLSYIYEGAYNAIKEQRPRKEGIIFPDNLVFGDVRFGIQVLQENKRYPNISIFMLRTGR